jgi:hypothetical protein
VPRLLGTHTCGTVVLARCTFGFLPLGEQVSCTCCVCAAWYGSPLYAHICILGLRSSLTTGLGSYLPTSAPGPSPIPTHICDWTESIPCPHLHRERGRPPPTSAPQPNPSPRQYLCHHCCPPGQLPLRNTSVAQQRIAMCCNHVRCVATQCHLCTIDPFLWKYLYRSKLPGGRRRLIRPGLLRPTRQTGSDRSLTVPSLRLAGVLLLRAQSPARRPQATYSGSARSDH